MRFNPQTKSHRNWLFIVAVPVAAFLIAGKTMNTYPLTNSEQTSPDAAPELRPRFYWQSVEEVNEVARAVVREQKTWFKSWNEVKAADNSIHVEIPVLFFTDDLTIHVEESEGQTRVNVTSKSRVGHGDFGENRRHIAQFLRALDERLDNSGILNP